MLEAETGRRFGAPERPLLLAVRSGAAVSMPGMLDTVLNLGIDEEIEAALATESGDAVFARDTHRRFHEMYARIVLKAEIDGLAPEGSVEGHGAPPWRRQGPQAACPRHRPISFSAPSAPSSSPGTGGARSGIAVITGSRMTRALPSRCRPWCSAT